MDFKNKNWGLKNEIVSFKDVFLVKFIKKQVLDFIKMTKEKVEKQKWYNTWWGVIIILLCVYFIFINSAGDYESSKPSYSLNEVMNNAKTISYDDLFRYNDQYVGTAVQ